MSLDTALGIAGSGLAAVQRALTQASQNVGNANTPGYTAKRLTVSAAGDDGLPLGVRTGDVQRSVDTALVQQIGGSTAAQAAANLRERLLQGVEAAYGTVSGSDSPSSLSEHVAALQSAFVALRNAPQDAGAQRQVVSAAATVASDFNAVGSAIGQARQQAQDGIVSEVAALNGTLRQLAGVTKEIRSELARGNSVAALEDKRDQLLGTLSGSLEVTAVRQPDGGLLLFGRGGLSLPLNLDKDAFTVGNATVGATSYYGSGGTLPGVLAGGIDVTSQVKGGRLGAAIELRDSTLPRFQAEADTAAASLAWRFDQQGLTLFTNGNGAVPDTTQPYATGGQAGFAGTVRVNPAVQQQPRLVRDGTHAVSTASGGLTNFTPNGIGGPAGFGTLASAVTDYVFGTGASATAGWPGIPTTGLGPDGTLSSPFTAPASIQDYIQQVQSLHAGARADATAAKAEAGDLLATLQQRFNTQSGVSIDNELTVLVQLQNAYSANARVLSTVQQVWDSLLQAVA